MNLNNGGNIVSEIFGDMISDEELKTAKDKLNPIDNVYYKMKEEVRNSQEGLSALLDSIERTHDSFDQLSSDIRLLEDIKIEFDKIAYLMDKFITNFKPIYQDCSNRYVAEKLAGSFDEKIFFSNSQAGGTMSANHTFTGKVIGVGHSSKNAWKK